MIKIKYQDRNLNKGTDKGRDMVQRSIDKFGMRDAVVIDKNGEIISGNHRKKAATKRGITKERIIEANSDEVIAIQYNDIDLSTPEGKELALALNQTAKFNINIDEEVAIEELGDVVEEWGIEIPVELEAEEDDFDMPDEVKTDFVIGDLFEIGDHRLLCGDSTDSDAVLKLMNGQNADMVFTDPPYGINIVDSNGKVGGGNKAKNGVYSKVIGDDTTETAKDFYQCCLSLGMENFIIWGGNYFTEFLPFSESWIIWDKRGEMNSNNFADGEMAWCSFKTRVRIYKQVWNGMIREGEKEKRVHPNQKPVKMLCEVIKDHIKGTLFFDGFLGSGSTMVAAHQLKRKCYGMELDPKYCQVIIDRMLKLDPSLKITRNGQPYEAK